MVGKVNLPIEPFTFAINRERARDYFNIRDRIYCFDGFAGWDYPIKIRVICSRPYHALFMHTMLIRPTKQQLAEYGKPDFVIYNADAFPANSLTQGMGSKTSIDLSFEDHEMVILGSEYAGEMKKGVFTLVNYLAPKRGILSMHCSATTNRRDALRCYSVCLVRVRRHCRPTPNAISLATMSIAGATKASSTSKAAATPRPLI